jgi:hypothetical protein
MGHSELDPAAREQRPWKGRLVCAKRAMKPQSVKVEHPGPANKAVST